MKPERSSSSRICFVYIWRWSSCITCSSSLYHCGSSLFCQISLQEWGRNRLYADRQIILFLRTFWRMPLILLTLLFLFTSWIPNFWSELLLNSAKTKPKNFVEETPLLSKGITQRTVIISRIIFLWWVRFASLHLSISHSSI